MARAVMRSLVDELLAGRSPVPSAHSIKEFADIARAEPPFAVGNKGIGRYVRSDPIGLENDASLFSYAGCDPISYVDAVGEKRSRAGKAEAIRKAENDPKQPRCVLGWFKNERRHAAQGGRPSESAGKWRREGNKAIRLPPGYDLAHGKGEKSWKGHGYRKCTLKDKATHKNETRAQRLKGVFGEKALPPLGPKIRINLLKRPRK